MMTEPRMPTTLPNLLDRDEFRSVAVHATGTAWEWVDHDLASVRVAEEAD